MSTAFLFPGQGSQTPGMLTELDAHPATRAVLEQADQVLHGRARSLDTAASLESTVAAQLGLLIVGVAYGRALQARDICPDFVAGHSVGAFGAAVIAGVLSFDDAIAVVEVRARLMEDAFPHGAGLAAVLGLPVLKVQRVVEATSTSDTPLYLAMENSADEIVVAGTDDALQKGEDLFRQAGARAYLRLQVHVPSHCVMLKPVADKLEKLLANVDRSDPAIGYIGNITGRQLHTGDAVLNDLARGVSHPVRWRASIDLLTELGVTTLVQLPPGHTTAQLAARDHPETRVIAVAERGLGAAINTLAKTRHAPPRSATTVPPLNQKL